MLTPAGHDPLAHKPRDLAEREDAGAPTLGLHVCRAAGYVLCSNAVLNQRLGFPQRLAFGFPVSLPPIASRRCAKRLPQGEWLFI